MAICRIFEVQGATLDQYDEVDSKYPDLPAGNRYHVAGAVGDTLYVIEVWESGEASDRWMEDQIGPELEEVGIPEPKVTEFEVHNEQSSGR
jgi:hypothetical protein